MPLTQRKTLLIDTDPGIDDALALLLAVSAPDLLTVRAVTTVAGNVPVAATSANARRILHLAGARGVPVIAGASAPLVRALHMATENHGDNGLGGIHLPDPTPALYAAPGRRPIAGEYLADTIMAAPSGIYTLCCLGPLTNIAQALKAEPAIASHLAEIVVFGGSVSAPGNVTATAEFNFYVDPEAAAIVLASGANLTLVPWDAARACLTHTKRREALRAIGEPLGPMVAQMIDFYRAYDEAAWGTDGGALPDPLVIAYLLEPELFESHALNLSVETGDEARGTLIVHKDALAIARVLTEIDSDGYFRLLTEGLASLNATLTADHARRADSSSR